MKWWTSTFREGEKGERGRERLKGLFVKGHHQNLNMQRTQKKTSPTMIMDLKWEAGEGTGSLHPAVVLVEFENESTWHRQRISYIWCSAAGTFPSTEAGVKPLDLCVSAVFLLLSLLINWYEFPDFPVSMFQLLMNYLRWRRESPEISGCLSPSSVLGLLNTSYHAVLSQRDHAGSRVLIYRIG